MNKEQLLNTIKQAMYAEDDFDYWSARELKDLLGYSEWRNFLKVIKKAKIVCEKSGLRIIDHFVEANKMIDIAKGAQRKIKDIRLSRHACYLICQNADKRKSQVDIVEQFFDIKNIQQIQHHKPDIQNNFFSDNSLLDDIKQLVIRTKNSISKTVNSNMTILYWNIGKKIHIYIENNKLIKRSSHIISELSNKLKVEFGKGFSRRNLFNMMSFYLQFDSIFKIIV